MIVVARSGASSVACSARSTAVRARPRSAPSGPDVRPCRAVRAASRGSRCPTRRWPGRRRCRPSPMSLGLQLTQLGVRRVQGPGEVRGPMAVAGCVLLGHLDVLARGRAPAGGRPVRHGCRRWNVWSWIIHGSPRRTTRRMHQFTVESAQSTHGPCRGPASRTGRQPVPVGTILPKAQIRPSPACCSSGCIRL